MRCQGCQIEDAGYHSKVYVHAELLIVDNVIYTIGSANYNQRGLMSDPELNVGVVDASQALALRRRVMNILVGNAMNEFGVGNDSTVGFDKWVRFVNENSAVAQTQAALPNGRVVAYAPVETDAGNISNWIAQTGTTGGPDFG